MRITITLDTDNAAFGDEDRTIEAVEVARILRALADDIEVDEDATLARRLRDINGNRRYACSVRCCSSVSSGSAARHPGQLD